MTDVPTCAATYAEGETACDGLYRKEKPCAWREHCRKLRAFFELTGLDVDATLRDKTRVEIEKLADAVNDDGFLKGTLADVLCNEDRAKPKSAHRFRENVWRLHKHFERQLADRFGEERLANRLHEGDLSRVVFLPGYFYPVDRSSSSARVSWYCKTSDGADKLLASLHFKPMLDAVDLALPVTLDVLREHFSEETLKKLHAVKSEWRQAKTLCRAIQYEGIGIAVGVLKKLVDYKVYPLPERWQ